MRTPGRLPAGTTAHEVVVDLSSLPDLSIALKGQDAVVSTLGIQSAPLEKALIEASTAPGATIRRFIPSGFGTDLQVSEACQWAVFNDKFEVEDILRARLGSHDGSPDNKLENGQGTQVTWTSVANNAFLDWGLREGFLLDRVGRRITLWDGGHHLFSATRLAGVAQAVVGVLRNPDATRNRTVYVQEAAISMRQLVEMVRDLEEDGHQGRDWMVEEASTVDSVRRSDEALARGVVERWVWRGYLYRAAFGRDTGVHFAKTDNELLGIKELDEEGIKEVVRKALSGGVSGI